MAWYDDLLKTDDEWDINKIAGLGTAGLSLLGALPTSGGQSVGYQGSIPKYTGVRNRVANTYDPNRRPGSGGQRYFSGMRYVPEGGDVAAARTASIADAEGLASLNLANPAKQVNTPVTETPVTKTPVTETPNTPVGLPAVPTAQSMMPTTASPFTSPYQSVENDLTSPLQITPYKQGGIAQLQDKKGKRYLDGKTDGMADDIPAMIDNQDPAALSDGEYVISADVVSYLGNGNSDAGAKVLDDMVARIRKEKTGTTEQAPEINPKEFLPA